MAVVYLLNKYKDVYTLENQGVASFSYILYEKKCDEEIVILNNNLLAGNTVTISIPKDGRYILQLTDNNDSDQIRREIANYKNFLTSIVKSTEEELCGCKCKDCDCDEPKKTDCLNTKLSVYRYLTREADNTVENISVYFYCRFDEGVTCNQNNNFFYAKDDCNSLNIDSIILQYLALYYYHLDMAIDLEEENYIKTKFKSSTILPCITRKGIDLTYIQTLL